MDWNAQEELDAEYNARYGDPRRCPRHPGIATSSGDGLHDAPCGKCEHEAYEAEQKADWEALTDEERATITAENDAWKAAEASKRQAALKALLDSDIPF